MSRVINRRIRSDYRDLYF